ncbi:AfsR/SARP family transcriptional regulator [Rhodovulum sp. DZ06]|uniref:AfsR/SARP family transcriptional regulator n=1 Tax=Rhodovulum sp. DZ06 TaxID=3425126 RepID=UPI003D3464FD
MSAATGPWTGASPGGAPKKTRTLFAYLLQKGEGGAHAEQIGELLWPEEGASEKTKRSRLHHTVAMLRKALGGREAVVRDGDFYRLALPPGSWIDIASFEQLCRRGLSLNRHGQHAAALRVYFAAERVCGGDLFADLPLDHVQSDTDDWRLPKRIWLREMALKLQHDMAGLLLREGRTGEALEHALKALAIEPASVAANIVAMRIFHAQNRVEAVHRQYRQYRAAAAAMGDGDSEPGEIEAVYAQLCTPRPARKSQPGTPLPAPQRKTIAGRIR